MSFCPTTTDPAPTLTTYNIDIKTAKGLDSLLPSGGFQETDGKVLPATVDSYVTTLLTQQGVVAPNPLSTDPTNASTYTAAAKTLRDKIKAEYCYYRKNYEFALTTLLTQALTTGVTAATLNQTGTAYDTLKTNTRNLNKKLNDLIELYNGLARKANTTLQGYYTGSTNVNTLNTDLQNTKSQLDANARLLSSADFEVEAKKAMIDYTLEKNNASRNMLGLYVFMNLVAGGLLFYIYRSS